MALRDKLRTRSQPFLDPGEQIQAVWLGQSGPSPWFAALSFWITLIAGHYHVVVATDRAIVVLDSGKLTPAKPKGLRVRGPRNVHLGPCHGLWGEINLDQRYYVHKRFHKDVAVADAALAQASGGPGPGGYGIPAPGAYDAPPQGVPPQGA